MLIIPGNSGVANANKHRLLLAKAKLFLPIPRLFVIIVIPTAGKSLINSRNKVISIVLMNLKRKREKKKNKMRQASKRRQNRSLRREGIRF